ncbi:hypothetical protein TWF481_001315 [Arthrobotrys musiformis]|uniref:HNH nuclease domain-containing protein n=1 Tax=Arthrobotrys musiformis TaxID=47236 RepID=A0AAV9WQ80_9PEZI
MQIDCSPTASAISLARRFLSQSDGHGSSYDLSPWSIERESLSWTRFLQLVRSVMEPDDKTGGKLPDPSGVTISRRLTRCSTVCKCNNEGILSPFNEPGGTNIHSSLAPTWHDNGRAVRNQNRNGCYNLRDAALCHIFGCFCSANLRNNAIPGPELAGNNIWDFLRAIDNIPARVRLGNANRGWGGWAVDDARAQFPGQVLRFSFDYQPILNNQDPVRQDNGILTAEQLEELARAQAPAMLDALGNHLFDPSALPSPSPPGEDDEFEGLLQYWTDNDIDPFGGNYGGDPGGSGWGGRQRARQRELSL